MRKDWTLNSPRAGDHLPRGSATREERQMTAHLRIYLPLGRTLWRRVAGDKICLYQGPVFLCTRLPLRLESHPVDPPTGAVACRITNFSYTLALPQDKLHEVNKCKLCPIYFAPSCLSKMTLKTTGRKAATFYITSQKYITHMVLIFWTRVTKGQVTSSGQTFGLE